MPGGALGLSCVARRVYAAANVERSGVSGWVVACMVKVVDVGDFVTVGSFFGE